MFSPKYQEEIWPFRVWFVAMLAVSVQIFLRGEILANLAGQSKTMVILRACEIC